MVLALQSYTGFSRFSAQGAVANLVVLSVTRELGPVLAGLMVAGRAGAAMAAELVRDQPTVIFAGGVEAHIRTIRNAVTTIPLVLASAGDPVELGLVASFNRPGGNTTVVTVITAALWPKRLEILREMLPPTNSIGLLVNPNNQTTEASTRDLQAAARSVGQSTLVLNASREADFDAAFATNLQSLAVWAERFSADSGRIARIVLETTVMSFITFSAAVAWLK